MIVVQMALLARIADKIFLPDYCWFPDIYVSQGSVATRLRCDGIFSDHFVTGFLLSLLVKEF